MAERTAMAIFNKRFNKAAISGYFRAIAGAASLPVPGGNSSRVGYKPIPAILADQFNGYLGRENRLYSRVWILHFFPLCIRLTCRGDMSKIAAIEA
jgi:hypothetical protein